MSNGLFFNIINQLRIIKYDGVICIHRYNEPLADATYTLLRLSSIRNFLPNAVIRLVTNGDYLDKELMFTLLEIGVNEILVTVHANNFSDTFEDVISELKVRVAKLNLPFCFENYEKENSFRAFLQIENLSITYQAVDFFAQKDNGTIRAYDRGGYIVNNSGFIRTKPCLIPFWQLQIEYDGTLLPCCNVHPDLDAHKNYVLGKLTSESNIFTEWTNDNYVNWRKKLIGTERKFAPCGHCNM